MTSTAEGAPPGGGMPTGAGSLTGAGGTAIFWQCWGSDRAPRAVVVIVHGAGEHSDRYGHVAAALVAADCAVYASDLRGHGRSQGPRAVIDRVQNAVADVDQLVVRARDAHPGVPAFVLGHSMGAMIAVRYTLAHQQRLAGLILSGTLASVHASTALRVAGRLISRVAPRLPLIAIDPALVSRDPAVVRAYRCDPLVHHGRLPARTAAEIADTVDGFPASVGGIRVPTLILYGTADRLCPPEGSMMLGERIGAADTTITAYPGLYHEILNEPERDTVLADIVGWLHARAG